MKCVCVCGKEQRLRNRMFQRFMHATNARTQRCSSSSNNRLRILHMLLLLLNPIIYSASQIEAPKPYPKNTNTTIIPLTSSTVTIMIRRPPTSLSVQESDVEALKAHRRAKMMQHDPNLTASSFSSIRPDESGSVHDHSSSHHHSAQHQHYHQHHHYYRNGQEDGEQEDPVRQPGLSQQENHSPNQMHSANGNS